jgi:AmmeMemoRadiSam system protein B
MEPVREPAVAGSFYPGNATELEAEVSRLLEQAAPGPQPKALIAPHAGYVYSGPVAASAFRRVQGCAIHRVVLLGPSHFVPLSGLALPAARAFATPLGSVPIEEAPFPRSAEAHAREHSLEVELPFLQVALGSFVLVPLAVGDAKPEEVAEALGALWGGQETLVVISSDLSHYLPYEEARAMDAATAKEILAKGRLTRRDACGAAPVNGLLHSARRRGIHVELLDLRNSGDTAGDK